MNNTVERFPRNHSPVLASYVLRLNEFMEEDREKLVPYFDKLKGTVGAKYEQERARILADACTTIFSVLAGKDDEETNKSAYDCYESAEWSSVYTESAVEAGHFAAACAMEASKHSDIAWDLALSVLSQAINAGPSDAHLVSPIFAAYS